MDNNAGSVSSVNSTRFPNRVRTGVRKGIGKGTRGRGLRYLAAAQGRQEAPPLTLGNFSQGAERTLVAMNAANAAVARQTQRKSKLKSQLRGKELLQFLANKGKNAAVKAKLETIPEAILNNNAEQTEGNETPLPKSKPAENLGNKQNRMSGANNLNALLGQYPLANPAANPVAANKPGTPAKNLPAGTTVQNSGFGPKYSMNFEPSSNATLSAFGTGGKASNINKGGINTNTNLRGPLALAPKNSNFANAGNNTQAAAAARVAEEKLTGNSTGANWGRSNAELNAARVGNTMMAAANTNYSGGFKKGNAAAVSNFEPSSNALLPGYGTGGKASNINKGGINTNTNLQGPLAFAPKESNFANAGGNTQEAAAARVAEEKLTGNSEGRNWAQSGTGLAQLAVAGTKPDYTITIVNSTVPAMPVMGTIGITIDPKVGGFGVPSMSLGMGKGMTLGMPRLPSFSGPKLDLSWLRLPKMPTITIPETHILESLGGFLAYLPSGKQIIAALKKGGEFVKMGFLLPIICAAWLWEHGFVFPKLDGLGGLIDLSDFFSPSNDATVKEIGKKLKKASDIAKRVITNTIAEQEFLQKQVNQKTRTQESVKDQILNSLDSQIKNIQSTFDELKVEVNEIVNNSEFGQLIADMGLEANPDYDFKAPTLDKLNILLNAVQAYYEEAAGLEDATASTKADVEKFKKIRANFKEIVELPQNIRNEIANTPASAVGKKLKELGIKARSRLAQMGQKISQSISNFGSRVAGVFSRQQTMSNANRAKAAAAVGRGNLVINTPIGAGNQTKKKSWRNKLSNAYSSAKGFFTRKAPGQPQPTGPNPGLNFYKSPKLKTARARRNRRHH